MGRGEEGHGWKGEQQSQICGGRKGHDVCGMVMVLTTDVKGVYCGASLRSKI